MQVSSVRTRIGQVLNRLLALVGIRVTRSATFARMLHDSEQLHKERSSERASAEDAVWSALGRLADEVSVIGWKLSELHATLKRELLQAEDRERDTIRLLLNPDLAPRPSGLRIATDHPIALDSHDHLYPRGTKNDNTRHPRFPLACERVFGRKVTHVDLGCAGGGLVWDFLLAGHLSVGVEGSDYSLLNQRAEWAVLPTHLFTADITHPFHSVDADGSALRFDVVTAWEVFEHIPQESIQGFLSNIRENLADGGLLVASIATFDSEDPETGARWHATVRPREEWLQLLQDEGFKVEEGLFQTADFVRGSGNPRAATTDWDVATMPEMGFHVVCRR